MRLMIYVNEGGEGGGLPLSSPLIRPPRGQVLHPEGGGRPTQLQSKRDELRKSIQEVNTLVSTCFLPNPFTLRAHVPFHH